MIEETDAELLRRYVGEKSESAFATLVQRRIDLVYSVARRQVGGDTHLAEDVTQQVFADLARKAPKLTQHPALSGWLCRSAQFAATDVVRTERRRRAREKETQIMHNPAATPEAEPEWEKLRPVLDQALSELGDRDRDAVALRFFEGRAFAEIGRALDLSEEAARKRVDRALGKLQARLARRGLTSTTAALSLALSSPAIGAAPAGLAASVTSTALAGALAAGSATTGAGLLLSMSTTKFTVGLVGLMLALAVGTTVHETYASFRAGAALAATYREIAVLSGRLQELRDHAKTAESASPGPKSTDEARTVEPPAAPHDPAAAGRAFLTRHPEVKQALVERARARVAGKYRSFYKAWELSPAQIAQFETLMMENEGWSTSGPDGALLLQPGDGLTASEVKNRMHDLLGDTVFPLFEDATHRALGIRQAVLELASATYFTDTPLTAQQADQLIQRGLEMRGVMSQLGAYMRSNPLAGPTVAEILLTETADVLTDTQLAALDGVIQQLQFRDSLGRALRQSAPPPPTGDAKPTP